MESANQKTIHDLVVLDDRLQEIYLTSKKERACVRNIESEKFRPIELVIDGNYLGGLFAGPIFSFRTGGKGDFNFAREKARPNYLSKDKRLGVFLENWGAEYPFLSDYFQNLIEMENLFESLSFNKSDINVR